MPPYPNKIAVDKDGTNSHGSICKLIIIVLINKPISNLIKVTTSIPLEEEQQIWRV